MFKEYKGKMVTIMSCSNCNTRCKHCYISYKGNFSPNELFLTASNLMKNNYQVIINGTEPLMNNYLDTYKLIGQYGAITNGLVFKNNYELLDKLKEIGFQQIRLSYHFNMHDEISKVPKSYLHELFEEIKKRGLKIYLMCSITSLNYKQIPQFCEECVKFGVSDVKFTNMLLQGGAKNLDNNLILNNNQINEFFKIIQTCRNKYSKDLLYIHRCGSFGKDFSSNNFKCPAGIDNLCITPDKKVYPCVFLTKPGYEIGYYDNGKIMIDENFINNGQNCLALEILNKIKREI